MGQVGITAINVADTENSVTLTNGNLIGDLGTYTKTDGSTGQTNIHGQRPFIRNEFINKVK
jgi:hypothetical protein